MPPQLTDARFDVRNIDRYLKNGEVSEEDYQRWLDSLEDSADNAAPARTRFIHRTHVPGEHVEDNSEED